MAVFLRLCREVLVQYWVPEVLGDRGRPFVEAFERSEEQFAGVLGKILNDAQQQQLAELIAAWRRENPDLVRVEAVRLTDFARQAGRVATERSKEVGGFLANVKGATQAADEAILLGERAMFLANRLPFLLRAQVRLATRDVISDATGLVESTQGLSKSVAELAPMVRQLPALVAASTEAARETRLLVEDVRPLIPSPRQVDRLQHTLDTTNDLVENTRSLVGDVRATTEGGPGSPMERIAGRINKTMSRGLGYLIALGAAWSLMWWGGYVLAKRSVRNGPSDRRPAHA
jgi:hypothetical protein